MSHLSTEKEKNGNYHLRIFEQRNYTVQKIPINFLFLKSAFELHLFRLTSGHRVGDIYIKKYDLKNSSKGKKQI